MIGYKLKEMHSALPNVSLRKLALINEYLAKIITQYKIPIKCESKKTRIK